MILNRQRTIRVSRRPLELFLSRLWQHLGLGEADVTICLVSDAEIARMNQAYRSKAGPTDVLSFPSVRFRKPIRLSRTPPAQRYLGDIAISPATARRNARKYGRALSRELQILMLHGTLHLLGYDHETDHGEMNRIEQHLQRRLGLA
jgi:probable rRNA maturation factor